MSLQSHRRHLQQLLTQTITVLCRNSLPFAAQFSVEGLLGITLDQDEVFLVNIRETVNKYAPDLVRHPSEESLHSPGHERLATNNAQVNEDQPIWQWQWQWQYFNYHILGIYKYQRNKMQDINLSELMSS